MATMDRMSASDEDPHASIRPVHRNVDALTTQPEEPPVVARMIIEIRSDGTRTIARGAIEDALSGERVSVHAEGRTPLALATSLAKSLFTAPALARHAVRALIESRSKKP